MGERLPPKRSSLAVRVHRGIGNSPRGIMDVTVKELVEGTGPASLPEPLDETR